MRMFVLVLAIVLLPLRGWVGDAVAMPVHGAHAAAQVAAQDAVSEHATAHCAGVAASDSGASLPNPHDVGSHHDCEMCQMCHSAAATLPQLTAPAPTEPQAAPGFRHAGFASVAPAPALKPPIS